MNESFNSISLFFNKFLSGKSNSSVTNTTKDLSDKMAKSSKKNSKSCSNNSDKENNLIVTIDKLNDKSKDGKNSNDEKILNDEKTSNELKLNLKDSLKSLEIKNIKEKIENDLNKTLNENNLKTENNLKKLENFDNFLINDQKLSINSNKLNNLKIIETNTFKSDFDDKNSLIEQNKTCSLVNLNDQQVKNNLNEELIIDCLTLVNDFDYSKNDLFNLNDQLISENNLNIQMLKCDKEKQLSNLNKDDPMLNSNSKNKTNEILLNEISQNKILSENYFSKKNSNEIFKENLNEKSNKNSNENLNENLNEKSEEKINEKLNEKLEKNFKEKQTDEKLIFEDQLPKNFVPPALFDKKDFEEISLKTTVNEENFEVIENEDVKQDCSEIAQLYPKSAKIFFQKSNKNESNDKTSKIKSSLFSVMKLDKNKYNSLDKNSKSKKYKEDLNLNNSKSDNVIPREIDIGYYDLNNKLNSGKIKKSSSFSSTTSVATTSSLENQTNSIKNELEYNFSMLDTNNLNKKESILFCDKNEKFLIEPKVYNENNFKNSVSEKFFDIQNQNLSDNPPIPPPRAITNKNQKFLRENCSTENLKKVNNYQDKILNENFETFSEENKNSFKVDCNNPENLEDNFYKQNLKNDKNKLTISLKANEKKLEQNNFLNSKSELNCFKFNNTFINNDLNNFKTNNGLWPTDTASSLYSNNLDKTKRSNSVKQLNWKKENFSNTQNQFYNSNQKLNSNYDSIKDLQIRKSNTMYNLDVSKKLNNLEYKKMLNSLKDSIQNLEKSFKKNLKKDKPKILNFNQKIIFETKENTFKPVIDNCILDASSTSSSSCSLCSSISDDSLENLEIKKENLEIKRNSFSDIKTSNLQNNFDSKNFFNRFIKETEPNLSLIKSFNTRSLSNLTYNNLNNRRLFKTSSGLFCPFRELSRIDESLDDEQNSQEQKNFDDKFNTNNKNNFNKPKNNLTNYISSLDNLHGLDNFTTNSLIPNNNSVLPKSNININLTNLNSENTLNTHNKLNNKESNLSQKIKVSHQYTNSNYSDIDLENQTLIEKSNTDFLNKNLENKNNLLEKTEKLENKNEESKIRKLDESYELNNKEDKEIIEIFDNKENLINKNCFNRNKLLLMNTNSCKSFEQNEKIVELESQLNSFKTKFDDSLNVIKILTEHCNDLIEVFNQKYNIKINEIDLLTKENKYLTKLNNELKTENINLNETCDDLKKHLNETEFNEQKYNFYEEKYSKIKNVLDYSRENEQQLAEELNNLKTKFQQNYELYEKVKTRAIEKVQSANEMIENANKTNDRELILTKMQLKKAEYKIAKLENDLDLKMKENQELSQLLNNLEN